MCANVSAPMTVPMKARTIAVEMKSKVSFFSGCSSFLTATWEEGASLAESFVFYSTPDTKDWSLRIYGFLKYFF
jgi:hypothetical protein